LERTHTWARDTASCSSPRPAASRTPPLPARYHRAPRNPSLPDVSPRPRNRPGLQERLQASVSAQQVEIRCCVDSHRGPAALLLRVFSAADLICAGLLQEIVAQNNTSNMFIQCISVVADSRRAMSLVTCRSILLLRRSSSAAISVRTTDRTSEAKHGR
jgi:hypothetical protein